VSTTDPPLIHPDDPDDDWETVSPTGRGLRVRAVTGSLVALAVLAGGFWGGVVAEKHYGSRSATTSASALAARFAAARGAAGTGATGFSGFGGGAGAATSGIVTGVVGDILYVTNSSGTLVKVTVGPSATITRTGKSSLSGLQTGDTVIVSGTTASNGIVSATSVRATAQGVSATGTGGFGAGGFGAGGGG
jgi:hypothetical protein